MTKNLLDAMRTLVATTPEVTMVDMGPITSEDNCQANSHQCGYFIKRLHQFDATRNGWLHAATAGCHGKALFFDKIEDTQEVIGLLNQAEVGFWQAEKTVTAPGIGTCDDYDLAKYIANLRESNAHYSWLRAESDVGYVVLDLMKIEYAALDVDGTVEVSLLTPYGEDRRMDWTVPIYTRANAEEIAAFRNQHNDTGIRTVAMAVEIYQRHWNQQADVGVPPADIVEGHLKQAREYMDSVNADRDQSSEARD